MSPVQVMPKSDWPGNRTHVLAAKTQLYKVVGWVFGPFDGISLQLVFKISWLKLNVSQIYVCVQH